MKTILILLASCSLLSGCASTATINRLETQSGQGVFHVVEQRRSQSPAGFGDLQVTLSLKTRNPGSVLIDTTGYGTEKYQLLIGVNGQTQRVTGAMKQEVGEYRGSMDPEAGNGTRYRFATTLRLPIGPHQVTFALPVDGVVLEHEVIIGQGANAIELKPVYRAKGNHRLLGFHGDRTFYGGVKTLIAAKQC